MDPDFSMDRLVNETEGMSGSDLKELCRAAAMVPVREYLREHMSELSTLKIAVRRLEHLSKKNVNLQLNRTRTYDM